MNHLVEAADIVLVAVIGTLTAEVAAVGVLDNIAAEHSRSGHQQDYIAKIAAAVAVEAVDMLAAGEVAAVQPRNLVRSHSSSTQCFYIQQGSLRRPMQ